MYTIKVVTDKKDNYFILADEINYRVDSVEPKNFYKEVVKCSNDEYEGVSYLSDFDDIEYSKKERIEYVTITYKDNNNKWQTLVTLNSTVYIINETGKTIERLLIY